MFLRYIPLVIGSLQSTSCSSDDAYVAVTVVLTIMAILLTTALVIALVALYRLYTSNRTLSIPAPSKEQRNVTGTCYRSNEAYESVRKSELQESTVSYEEVEDEQLCQSTTSSSYSEVKETGITAGDDDADYVI